MPPHEGEPSVKRRPTLSILIPTKGGGDLLYVFQTISAQELIEGDEVLVIGDGPQPQVAEQVNVLGPPFRYAHTDKPTADFGHSQLNYGLSLATGDYIMCTDDDDGYLPRALESVRTALEQNPGRPHIFKFWSNDRYLVWNESRGRKTEETFIGGHNLVLPNTEGKKGTWSPRYRGDLDWVKGVLENYPETEWVWRDEVLTRQRPNAKLVAWPVWTRYRAWGDRLQTMRVLRNECRADMTNYQAQITEPEQVRWFESLMPWKDHWAWLFTVKDGDPKEYVGFLYLRRGEKAIIPSYGISEKHRGRGHGKGICSFMIDAMQGDGEAEIWARNEVSRHLFQTMGWRETGITNGLVTLKYEWPR